MELQRRSLDSRSHFLPKKEWFRVPVILHCRSAQLFYFVTLPDVHIQGPLLSALLFRYITWCPYPSTTTVSSSVSLHWLMSISSIVEVSQDLEALLFSPMQNFPVRPTMCALSDQVMPLSPFHPFPHCRLPLHVGNNQLCWQILFSCITFYRHSQLFQLCNWVGQTFEIGAAILSR